MKKIVILGAGYGGVLTAKKLAKKVKKSEDIQIVLIDKNPFHTMLTELHEVAAGRVEEDSIRINLEKIFAGRKVKIILDNILDLSLEENKLIGERGKYSYNYLVLAAGSKPAYFGVPGAEKYSYKLWSYEDAVLLRERIEHCFYSAAGLTDPAEQRRLLTFYIVGAGFTGVEMAGELAEYVPILCNTYQIDPGEVSITLVDAAKRTVQMLPVKLSDKVERRLKKMHVTVSMETSVTEVGTDFIELLQNEVKHRCPAGTVIWTAGIESSHITSLAADSLESSQGGRIKTDAFLRAIGHENIFVLGDNLYYIPEGEEQPVPQLVENCEQGSNIAAHNLFCALRDGKDKKEYRPRLHGVMVSVGGRYGVARVGFPGRMINLPSFFAMFVKHFINVAYFVQVAGWSQVFSYLRHEFFTIRHSRSFVGGHFSNRTPSFLLAPLRVWLGLVWIFEAAMKIVEGWFTKPMLTGFFGGARSWFEAILANAAAGAGNAAGTADAVTSATAATGEAAASGTAVFSYHILGMFDVSLVSGKPLSASSLADYGFKVDLPLADWVIDKWILPVDGVQVFMQVLIVLLELAIGLALAGGLFTFLSSAASLILQAMFVTTTGIYLSTLWMVFAAVAVLVGGGYTLGLDYYVLPYLKRKWKKLPFVRKWYLYHD